MTPLIPYITIPELPILPSLQIGSMVTSPLTIKPFGTLVATGVYIGWRLANRQAKRLGLDFEAFNSFITWMLVAGFTGGHWLDLVFYHSSKLTEGPWLERLVEFLAIWRSQASFGGFIGAFVGVMAWKIHFKQPILPYADTVCSAFPLAWVFGRSGCSVAHDHPGLLSDAWFAVKYPFGARFDLGLYEMLLTIPLALSFLYLMRKPRPYGLYGGLMSLAYAPLRFALDFLRATDVPDADPRHFGLTPAQWLCIALFLVGLYFTRLALRAAARGETPHYIQEKVLSARKEASEPPSPSPA